MKTVKLISSRYGERQIERFNSPEEAFHSAQGDVSENVSCPLEIWDCEEKLYDRKTGESIFDAARRLGFYLEA